MTSYLGEVVLASGTFAALRDLANYGATLLFDDAEGLGNPKCDPDKRALLLAGNRRGATIPLKEAGPNGTWHTRWVNAFCPRGFTAISLPDAVLASRSIVMPLARTEDGKRGNVDPANVEGWPCDRRVLLDDLWALGLSLLSEAEEIWRELDDETEVVGREFEPWRALIAIARMLERHGVEGLERRIRLVMRAYQAEKSDLLTSDRTILVIRALLALVEDDTSDTRDADDTSGAEVTLSSSKIAEVVKRIADDDEQDGEWASPSRVGRILRRLRIKKAERTAKQRGWVISLASVRALARAYGVITESAPPNPEGAEMSANDAPHTDPEPDSVTYVTSVTCVTHGAHAGPDERERFEL
jgi:hypothetical protein